MRLYEIEYLYVLWAQFYFIISKLESFRILFNNPNSSPDHDKYEFFILSIHRRQISESDRLTYLL